MRREDDNFLKKVLKILNLPKTYEFSLNNRKNIQPTSDQYGKLLLLNEESKNLRRNETDNTHPGRRFNVFWLEDVLRVYFKIQVK